MRVLFVHQNFPGQFVHLSSALVAEGHEVRALSIRKNMLTTNIPVTLYTVKRGTTQGVHPWAGEIETKVLRGEACARAAMALKRDGFIPDVICVHPAWGEALFLREVWPSAKQLHYVEFFYSAEGQDVGFDPEFGEVDFDSRCRIRMKNANSLLNLDVMDVGISPTQWQWSTVPRHYRDAISVIHDGINTAVVRPQQEAVFTWRNSSGLSCSVLAGDPIVTFVNRNLEPCRGYHTMMRALPRMMRENPNLQVFIVGGDEVSYGTPLASGSYKQKYLTEVAESIDSSRLHFLGRIPYSQLLRLWQVSAAHIYLTYPFVLSWSMLEAMSSGCLVIGSRTPPVEEVIIDGYNGLLVDFFSPDELAERVTQVLRGAPEMCKIKRNARQTILDKYDLKSKTLPRQLKLVKRLIE